ncbi:hypothetical protein D3C80_1702810 [compost metagenome]
MANSASAQAVSKVDNPVAVSTAQNSEPLMTPAARTSAGLRPSRIAAAMIAMLLGPGLAAARAYAPKASASV